MIARVFHLFLFVLLFCVEASAQKDDFVVRGLKDSLGPAMAMVPGETAKAASIYLDTYRPFEQVSRLGDRNHGVMLHFADRLNADPCLSSRAFLFYQRMRFLNDSFAKTMAGQRKTKIKTGAYSQAETAGEGALRALKPGWLWDEAMKFSGGDSGEAISLIAICGHDDTNNSLPGGTLRAFSKDPSVRKALELVNKQNWANGRMGPPTNCSTDQKSNILFVPRSLGADVDISDELKKEILDVQYPTAGVQGAPAETYHHYTSAYIACQMIEKGISNETVLNLVPKLSNVYRRLRLCEDLAYMSNVYEGLKLVTPSGNARDGLKYCRTTPGEKPLACRHINPTEDKIPDSPSENENVVEQGLVAKMFYTKMSCPNTIRGLANEARVGSSAYVATLTSIQKMPCPDGETGAACTEAKKTLKTWETDFRWTESQHRIGVEFAIAHCKKKPDSAKIKMVGKNAADPLENNCPILEPEKAGDAIGTATAQ